jgi:hypothetical protein
MGGAKTALLEIKRLWVVQMTAAFLNGDVTIYNAVHKDDSHGIFLQPDLLLGNPKKNKQEKEVDPKFTSRLKKSSFNKATCRRYVVGDYYKNLLSPGMVNLDGAQPQPGCQPGPLILDPRVDGDVDIYAWVIEQKPINLGDDLDVGSAEPQRIYTFSMISMRNRLDEIHAPFLKLCNDL